MFKNGAKKANSKSAESVRFTGHKQNILAAAAVLEMVRIKQIRKVLVPLPRNVHNANHKPRQL